MTRWLVGSSVKAPTLVVAIAAVTLVLGVAQVREMPRDVLPEFGPPTVEIQTEALGLSAVEVEQLITVPLEQDLLNGVVYLRDIRSQSVAGLSSIELVFEPGTDLTKARQAVNERLVQAHALPNVSKPPQMLQPVSSTSRVVMIGLSSRQLSLLDMGVLARWTIRPRLMGVPGVANVAIWGQRDRQLQVRVDPALLQEKGVSLDQVITTTGNALWWSPLGNLEANTPGTGGFIDGPNQRLGIFHESPIKTPEDLARVDLEDAPAPPSATPQLDDSGIAPPTTAPLTIGDVATVVEDNPALIGEAGLTDGPGLLLVIEKFPEANVVDVTHGVEQALDTLAPGLSGVQVDTSVFRPATYVERSSTNITRGVLLGLALFVLFALLCTQDWRSALISFVAIVLSMLAAVAALDFRGATLNSLVIAGLALGLGVLVDDAVMSTHTVRRAIDAERDASDRTTAATVIRDATLDVRRPLTFATAVLLLSWAPVFALKGEAGEFLPPLAIACGAALLASAVIAMTITRLSAPSSS